MLGHPNIRLAASAVELRHHSVLFVTQAFSFRFQKTEDYLCFKQDLDNLFILQEFRMPKHCSSVGCHNREAKDSRKNGLTFHSYPKDESRRKLWANAVRRQNWQPTNSSYLCSEHFKPTDFKENSTNMRKLKDDVIPSIFKNHPEHLQKRSPLKRRLPFRQRQEEEVQAAKR